MVKYLDHVTITVSDMEKSVYFYRELLGLEVIGQLEQEDGLFVFLKAGEYGMIELFAFEKQGVPFKEDKIEDIGLKHLALTVENVDQIFERLEGAGIEVIMRPQSRDGVRQAFVADPDGISVELMEGELKLEPYGG